jgi:hypothetical protein
VALLRAQVGERHPVLAITLGSIRRTLPMNPCGGNHLAQASVQKSAADAIRGGADEAVTVEVIAALPDMVDP